MQFKMKGKSLSKKMVIQKYGMWHLGDFKGKLGIAG